MQRQTPQQLPLCIPPPAPSTPLPRAHLLLHHICHERPARAHEPAQRGGRRAHGVHLCARLERLHQHLDQVAEAGRGLRKHARVRQLIDGQHAGQALGGLARHHQAAHARVQLRQEAVELVAAQAAPLRVHKHGQGVLLAVRSSACGSGQGAGVTAGSGGAFIHNWMLLDVAAAQRRSQLVSTTMQPSDPNDPHPASLPGWHRAARQRDRPDNGSAMPPPPPGSWGAIPSCCAIALVHAPLGPGAATRTRAGLPA